MSQSSITACNAAINARNALLNGGSVEIKTGAAPDIDAAPTGTVMVTYTLLNPAFANASNRTATLNLPASVTATLANTGGAAHYVVKNSSGDIEGNGSAGTSGTDMILNTLTWGIGDDVSITSWNVAQPK